MSNLLLETMWLPPIPVMHAIVRHSGVIFEAHEHYQKRSFRNRIYLLGPQGIEQFSIPLQKGKNQQQNIRSCRISYNENWPLQFIRMVRSNYGSAPYFNYYIDELEEIIFYRWERLWELNLAYFRWIQRCLHLDHPIQFTVHYARQVAEEDITDIRGRHHPGPTYFHHASCNRYEQVFSDKHGFTPNLSVLDLLMCCGPESLFVLQDQE